MDATPNLRTLTISSCEQCYNHLFDGDATWQWGKHWCDVLDIEVTAENIPEICPLPKHIKT